jgi:hypothetical protein
MNLESTTPIPDGSAWAALLAAGVGCAAFGLFTDLSEASARASKLLLWYRPSGSLSGVAGCAVIVWVAVWAVLHYRWRGRKLDRVGLVIVLTVLLVVIGIVTTFPPFYELMVSE